MSEPMIIIDTNQVSEHIRMELLSVAYDDAIAYFEKPGVEERYECWKAARMGRRKGRSA